MNYLEYEVKLADGRKIQTTGVEITELGIKFPLPDSKKTRFVPYAALLWVDHNE